ncbi:MurR/RpiR family transcriptional regulator [Streptacidiphilus fuscans]|uniref:MurR/RpiR family transcriptional regulator n=1 Tax=Streptacidiphilus fuscans TaxID=2789292 RepID=A0A931FIT9_9ACTN|nr:MurR/RpiR family transcriptional regulator [Streptacidiphilus fuscans]MBF9073266.1 MurR/RpiR family transcriptional regulator [Streptacidiphilus fuscans]
MSVTPSQAAEILASDERPEGKPDEKLDETLGEASDVPAGVQSGGPSSRLLKLFEGYRLTPTQRRIAHCLVRNAAEAPFLSSVEVAELAGVSQPSVTRFAVALGFDGYPALRRQLRELGLTEPGETPGAAGGGARETPGEVVRNEQQQAVLTEIANLQHLASVLADPEPVLEAARILAASRPLVVLGLRAASAQANGFAYFAAKVHPDVRLLDEGGSMLLDRIEQARVAGATALICFALPRHPRELMEALTTAKAAGLTVVTVADSAFAPVASLSDLLLPAAVGSSLVFDTACAPMMLGRVLLQAMCDELPDSVQRLEDFEQQAAGRGLFLG